MPLGSESGKTLYQLRYAAGIYWLLDMSQPGYPYRKPLPLNEMGASIWRMMEKGWGQERWERMYGTFASSLNGRESKRINGRSE